MPLLTELWVSWPQTPGLRSPWGPCPEPWIQILPPDLLDVQELPVFLLQTSLWVRLLLIVLLISNPAVPTVHACTHSLLRLHSYGMRRSLIL